MAGFPFLSRVVGKTHFFSEENGYGKSYLETGCTEGWHWCDYCGGGCNDNGETEQDFCGTAGTTRLAFLPQVSNDVFRWLSGQRPMRCRWCARGDIGAIISKKSRRLFARRWRIYLVCLRGLIIAQQHTIKRNDALVFIFI